MSNEMNDLIADARRAQSAVYLATEKSVADDLARIIARLADALEAATRERAAVPDAAIRELTEAIRLTVEYTGNDMLPAIEGWDWYDALVKYAPEVAQAFVDKPIHFPKPTNAEAERDAALAALERVRAIHAPSLPGYGPKSCVHDGRAWPCPTIQALDGAPEPEEKP